MSHSGKKPISDLLDDVLADFEQSVENIDRMTEEVDRTKDQLLKEIELNKIARAENPSVSKENYGFVHECVQHVVDICQNVELDAPKECAVTSDGEHFEKFKDVIEAGSKEIEDQINNLNKFQQILDAEND